MKQSARISPAAHPLIHRFTMVMSDNPIRALDTDAKAENFIGGTDFDLR